MARSCHSRIPSGAVMVASTFAGADHDGARAAPSASARRLPAKRLNAPSIATRQLATRASPDAGQPDRRADGPRGRTASLPKGDGHHGKDDRGRTLALMEDGVVGHHPATVLADGLPRVRVHVEAR